MAQLLKSVTVTCPFRYVSNRRPSPWAAGYHPGIDFAAAIGTSVYAPADSHVIHAGTGGWGTAYGVHVVGETTGTDGKAYRWIAAHLSKEVVAKGQRVKAGDLLGHSGKTGSTFGAHLHFEVRKAPYAYANHVHPDLVLNVRTSSTPTPQSTPDAPAGTFTILPRGEWTSEPNGRIDRPLDPSRVNALTIHYPADGPVIYTSLTKDQVAARLRAYRNHHLDRGWADIGYNYAIDQIGRVWNLTGDTIGAHAGSEGNPTSLGVLFVIGNNERPTSAAITAFKELRALKLKSFPGAVKVQGHQQVPGNQTACPGVPLMELIQAGAFTEEESPPMPPNTDVCMFNFLGFNIYASQYTGGAFTAKRKAALKAVFNDPAKGARASWNALSEINRALDHDTIVSLLGRQFANKDVYTRASGNNHHYPDENKWVVIGRIEKPLGSTTKQNRKITLVTAKHKASGRIVSFWCSHLSSVSQGATTASARRSRETEARAIARLIKGKPLPDWDVARSVGYVDANDERRTSATPLTIISGAGVRELQDVGPVGSGEYNSLHALGRTPAKDGKRIDLVFLGSNVSAANARQIAAFYSASDHLPQPVTLTVV